MTPLRWATGQAWPLQFRRMLGLFAFTYAALHFTNYLLLDRALDFGEILPDIVKRPYITIGFTRPAAADSAGRDLDRRLAAATGAALARCCTGSST